MKLKTTGLFVILLCMGSLVSAQKHNVQKHTLASKLKTDVMGSNPQHVEEAHWDNMWLPFATQDLKYDAVGHLIEQVRSINTGQTKKLFSYDESGRTVEIIEQLRDNAQWVNHSRSSEIYDGDYYMGWRQEEWQNEEWVHVTGERFTYQMEGGRASSLVIETKRGTDDWVNTQRYNYTYDGDEVRPAVTIMEIWDSESWMLSFKDERAYPDEWTHETIHSAYINGSWEMTSKTSQVDDAYGSQVITMYTLTESAWIEMRRANYINDSFGNRTLILIELYDDGWEPYGGTQYLLSYDGNKLIERITQQASQETESRMKSGSLNWTNQFRELFSNFYIAGSEDIEKPSLSLQIYPNPVSETLNLKIINPDKGQKVNVILINLAGQKTKESAVWIDSGSNQIRIPVTAINRGHYIIQVSDASGAFLFNQSIQIY